MPALCSGCALRARAAVEALESRLLLAGEVLQANPELHVTPHAPVRVQASQEPPSMPAAPALPASFDLRPAYVTAVRDQGSCGSCWAFATYGSLESSILKDGGPITNLSENNLKNYHGFDFGPCDGGNTWISEAYLSRGSGPVSEADDPYHPWDDRLNPLPSYPRQYWVTEMLRYDTQDEIKNALMTLGALNTAMYWTDAAYRAADCTYYYDGGTMTNHEVTLVGWDDNKLTAAATPGAWLAKNSWGSIWGNNGYFWLSYADSSGGQAAESFGGALAPSVYSQTYYWDDFGDVGELNCPCAMNRFIAQGAEQLKAIGFFTQADSAGYTISIYDSFPGGTPSTLLSTTTGTAATAGWHTVTLSSSVGLSAGNDFYIVVGLSNGGAYPHAYDFQYPDYSSASTAAANQSWYSFDGSSWTDLASYDSTANFCIKAYTSDTPPAGVDLVGNGFQLASPSLCGGRAEVSFSVANRGSTAAGAFTVKFYLSEDAVIDPASDLLLMLASSDPHYDPAAPAAYRMPGLAGRASAADSLNLAVPASDPFASGSSYYLGMVVDADGEVAEVTESNNRNGGEGVDRVEAIYLASLFFANMDTNPGWTFEGAWAWGRPAGGGGTYGSPDPVSGYTGANVVGDSLDGPYANRMPITCWATTPTINCLGISNVKLTFYRWLGVEQGGYDNAYLQYSTDGTHWMSLWRNFDTVCDTAWTKVSYDLPAAANQPSVRLRWGLGPTDTSWNYCGWNIDDVQLVGTASKSATPGVPDLISDSGTSATDDLTNLDNGQAGRRLQFRIAGTIAGATVELYADGILVGSALATSGTTTLWTDGVTHLADGSHSFTACQTESGEGGSDPSAGLPVVIDTTPLVAPAFRVNSGATQRSVIKALTVTFAESPTLLAGALTFKLSSGSAVPNVTVNVANASGDGKTYVLSFAGTAAIGGSLPDGIYDLLIASAKALDQAGNPMAGDYTQRFHRLFGDADGNKVVNALDYAKLKATYGRSSADPLFNAAFDYEGNSMINALDLAQFRKRYGLLYSY